MTFKLKYRTSCTNLVSNIHISPLTIHAREVQDTDPRRSYIQPCHDNRLFRTFLMIMIIVTHRPVPTNTPPTIFWVSVDRYRLWTETKTAATEMNITLLLSHIYKQYTKKNMSQGMHIQRTLYMILIFFTNRKLKSALCKIFSLDLFWNRLLPQLELHIFWGMSLPALHT